MGSSSSSDSGKSKATSTAYHAKSRGRATEETLAGVGKRRADGAVENLSVHEGAILGIASAGVGEFLTCGEDKILRLHNLDGDSGSFRNTLSFAGHTRAVARATYGEETHLTYSCSRDTTLRQWSRSADSALLVFEGHDLTCTALALSADERHLCSGSRDTSVRIWDVQTGQCTASSNVPRNLVTCLEYLPGEASTSVVQGGEDLRLRVWDVREAGLRPSMTVEGYTFFPVSIDVDPDCREVLTSCKGYNGVGCETKLWDLRNTASPLQEFTGHTQDTTACVFLDARQEGDRGERRREAQGGVNAEGNSCCEASSSSSLSIPSTSASRRMIATASKDGTIKIYDRNTGRVIVDHTELECGGYTGLAYQKDPSTGLPVLYASTITGGLYAFRLEAEAEGGAEVVRLRCVGFVRGCPIL